MYPQDNTPSKKLQEFVDSLPDEEVNKLMSIVYLRAAAIAEEKKNSTGKTAFTKWCKENDLPKKNANKLAQTSAKLAHVKGIEKIDAQTIQQLSAKRYEQYVEKLEEVGVQSAIEVQEEMKEVREMQKEESASAKVKKEDGVVALDKNGKRYLDIPPIYEVGAVSALPRMMQKLGRTAQSVITDAIYQLELNLFGESERHLKVV